MTPVEWSPRASSQFDEIYEYLLNNFASVARRQADRILEAIGQLSHYPESGTATRFRSNRKIAVPRTPYIVFYRLKKGVVEVTAIRHGAQKPLDRTRRNS